MTDEEYEALAPINAAKCHMTSTVPGAVVGFMAGGPIGMIAGAMLACVLFGAPKALAYDSRHNEEQARRRGR